MLLCLLLGKYESTEEWNAGQVSKESDNMLKDKWGQRRLLYLLPFLQDDWVKFDISSEV